MQQFYNPFRNLSNIHNVGIQCHGNVTAGDIIVVAVVRSVRLFQDGGVRGVKLGRMLLQRLCSLSRR